jgi:hypothetical protein
MVPGAGSTIATLKRIEKKVFVVSGGITTFNYFLFCPRSSVFCHLIISTRAFFGGSQRGYRAKDAL